MRQRMCSSCSQQMRGTEQICPHCRSLQGLTLRAKLGLTLLALFVLSPLVVDSMPSSWGAATNANTHLG